MEPSSALRRKSLSLTVAILLLATIGVASPAGATSHHPTAKKYVRIANGVTLWRQSFVTSHKRHERAVLLRVDLHAKGVSVKAVAPRHGIGATRQTVLTRARELHAVGGINGDFFDLHSNKAVPRGAVVRSGDISKTPRPYWRANLYINYKGNAGIGAVRFVGKVSRGTRGGKVRVRAHRIFSVNTVLDALKGRITYVNAHLAATKLPSCTVAHGITRGKLRIVTSVATEVTYFHQLTGSHWALVSCRGKGASWLRDYLIHGDSVSLSMRFPAGQYRTIISGGRVLVEHGRAFNDVGGEVIWRSPPNPETFACVSVTGRHLLLGTIDGRSKVSVGLTYAELTRYLLKIHCYKGIVFDGGGSTTMVARTPGHKSVTVQNHPSEKKLRPVPNGFYVFAH